MRDKASLADWLAVGAGMIGSLMALMDISIVNSSLPVIQGDLGSSTGQLAWFLNAYTLVFATFMLPAAILLGLMTLMTAEFVTLQRLAGEHAARIATVDSLCARMREDLEAAFAAAISRCRSITGCWQRSTR